MFRFIEFLAVVRTLYGSFRMILALEQFSSKDLIVLRC